MEFELDEALGRLERQAENAAQSVGDSSVSPPEVEETESIEDLVFDEAKTSPKVALMSLAARIERESQEILASSQEPATWERRTLFDKVKRLDVSPFVKSAALQFQHVRNRIVHDPDATDEDALRAIDAGLTILEAL
ncbi:MAG: hypothetical protein QOE38_2765, partial [Thermoleophilaceae bacterium]|nr:hypothetical protein [Thermoleophilaceae bacterium]